MGSIYKRITPWPLMLLVIASSVSLVSCTTSSRTEHYVSPQIEGVSQRINLDEVEKAFLNTKAEGKDLNAWMGVFEKRVNEIYDGDDVVSIDATRKTGKLEVTGFIDKNKEPGYQAGEDKLFAIEQTGDVANDQMPYRVADERGVTYREGSHSILDNPFIQMMLVSQLLGGFGGRYYTPYHAYGGLRDHRNAFRTTPAYSTQKAANSTFSSRFKQKAVGGGYTSRTPFGSSPSASGSRSRYSNPSSPSVRTSPWGGRRSSGFGRGWGGRRR